MVGETLLHYQVLSKLGEGGMGEVYLAVDTKLERQVALKVLPQGMATNPRRWERFVREARAVAALNHPNIVTIFAVEEAGGRHFFAMELVEGDTLERAIPREGMELDRFFAVAAPMLDALATAHRQGILHRDLKPENVMLSRDGRVKILDFGVAKTIAAHQKTDVAGEAAQRGITEEGAVLGTARYMSPEQARGEAVDQRSDLFSLGIIFFEMATGSYPFRGRSTVEILSSILRDEAPFVNTLRRTLPRALGVVVNRLLQKHPNLRYASAEEVWRDLAAIQGQLVATPASQPQTITVEQPTARARGGERRTGTRSGTSGAVVASLAVLPLTDLGGGPDYFVEGLTEELITALAKVSTLRVISRQSVMRYRGSDKLLPEIARELGVDHVLEGSVMRAGDRVRISVQLVRAEPEQHLWAERYERDIGDVLAVQSEVARAVMAEIQGKLTTGDEARFAPGTPVSPAVLEAYLKGRHYWNKRTVDNLQKAVTCFQEAIDADPTHAPSYSGLADALAILGQLRPAFGIAARAKGAARKALEIDPGLADAHVSLGFVSYFYDWEWAQAEAELRRGIELAPNNANAHHWYWSLLLVTGRPDQALREIRRAVQLDPLSPVIATNHAVHFWFQRDYNRALTELGKALELEPTFFSSNLALWRVRELRGEHDAAATALGTALRSAGHGDVAATLEQTQATHGAGLPGYEAAMRATADLLVAQGTSRVPLEAVAWMYLACGQRSRALELVEEAFEKRRPGMVWLAAPDWDPLASEPRFRELIELVGLSPQAGQQNAP